MTKKQRYQFDEVKATASRAKITRIHGEMNLAELTFTTKTNEVITFELSGTDFIDFIQQQLATYQAIYPHVNFPRLGY